MKKSLPIVLAALMAPASLMAQKAIKNSFDTKVIRIDSLTFAENLSAYEIISILPEVLQRPGMSTVDNYDIMIQDMPLSAGSDVALYQLMVCDIERIEIDESPVSSYHRNGQGGSINIFLRNKSTKGKSVWGSASLDGETTKSISPQLTVGYHNNKFVMNTMLISGWFKGDDRNYTMSGEGASATRLNSSKDYYNWGQMAGVFLTYNHNASNTFKLNATELTKTFKDDEKKWREGAAEHIYDKNDSRKKSFNLMGKYIRAFSSHSKLESTIQYNYSPSTSGIRKLVGDAAYNTHDIDNKVHDLMAKVEYVPNLFHKGQSRYFTDLTIGTQLRGTFTDDDSYTTFSNGYADYELLLDSKSFFFMPYLKTESHFGPVGIKAVLELQHYYYDFRYKLAKEEFDPENRVRNDLTAKLIVEWEPRQNHILRVMADRKIQRASEKQISTALKYDPVSECYDQGNTSIKPMLAHEFTFDYLFDYDQSGQHVHFNAGLSYNYVSDLITAHVTGGESGSSLGSTLRTKTYLNDGNDHVINLNLMGYYSQKRCTAGLNANFYSKHEHKADYTDYYRYCNVRAFGQFVLPDHWNVGSSLTYYSKVDRKLSSLGDALISDIQVGKTWGGLNIYAYCTVNLMGKTEDFSAAGSTYYYLKKNSAGVGVNYSF